MTTWQELYQIYIDDMQKHYEYRTKCLNFAHNFIVQMAYSYLQWDGEAIESIDLTNPSNYRKFNHLNSAESNLLGIVHLVEEDFWHFGVRLKIIVRESVVGIHKEASFIVPLYIKEEDNLFHVKLEAKTDEYRGNNPKNFEDVFEEISQRIRKVVKINVQKILDRNDLSQEYGKVGFILAIDKIKELDKQSKNKLKQNQFSWLEKA